MDHIKESIETILNIFLPHGVVEWILAFSDLIGIYVMFQITTGKIHLLTQIGELCVTYATFASIIVTIIIKILPVDRQ